MDVAIKSSTGSRLRWIGAGNMNRTKQLTSDQPCELMIQDIKQYKVINC
uniref:Uncharacterized protein n=1 Tax=Anopheles albimanus TaxID=7167 RepID=A0A182F3Q9_ANOAL